VDEKPQKHGPDVAKIIGDAALGGPEGRKRLSGLAGLGSLRALDEKVRAAAGMDDAAREKLAKTLAGNFTETAERMRRATAGVQRAELDQFARSNRVNEMLAESTRRKIRREVAIETATLGTYDELTRLNHGIVELRLAQEEADERQRATDETVIRLERESVLYARLGFLVAAATFAAVVVGTTFGLAMAATLGVALYLRGARRVPFQRGVRSADVPGRPRG
jgi:hypothetical protein